MTLVLFPLLFSVSFGNVQIQRQHPKSCWHGNLIVQSYSLRNTWVSRLWTVKKTINKSKEIAFVIVSLVVYKSEKTLPRF